MAKLIRKDQGHKWVMEIPDNKVISISPYTENSVKVTINWNEELEIIECEEVTFK